jgi:hypothetical protein
MCALLSTSTLVLGPPLGYGLDVSGLDARILKEELVSWPLRGNLNWDPTFTQSWLGIFSSAPIGSANWYFLSFDSRNRTGHRVVGRVGLRYLTIPSDFTAPNHLVVRLPGLATQFGCCYTSQGDCMGGLDSNTGCKFKNKTKIKTVLWVEPLPYNRIYTSVGQQTGFIEGGPHQAVAYICTF